MSRRLPSKDRVRRAIVRLEETQLGRLAKEEAEEGISLREILHFYDLSFQQVEEVRAVLRWVRHSE